MTYRYLVIIEKADGGFSAYSPDVLGCVATGRTVDAAQTAMTEAIEFHLEGLALSGEPIPQPRARHAFTTVTPTVPPKSLRHTAYHIVPAEGKWFVKKAGAARATRVYGDKASAVQRAKQLARRQAGRVLIHNKDGTIREVSASE